MGLLGVERVGGHGGHRGIRDMVAMGGPWGTRGGSWGDRDGGFGALEGRGGAVGMWEGPKGWGDLATLVGGSQGGGPWVTPGRCSRLRGGSLVSRGGPYPPLTPCPPPDQLSECWGALGLPRDTPLGPSCASCQRPLHFSLMSDWERQHFQLGGVPVMG